MRGKRRYLAGVLIIAATSRLSYAQTFTRYSIPTPNAIPRGMALGADGALWFTEQGGQKIGRIGRGGAVTEYALPRAESFPSSVGQIILGPDGNLWFAEDDAIGRITPAGAVSEFATGIYGPPFWSMTVGADGNLWYSTGFVMRMSPAGVPALVYGGPQWATSGQQVVEIAAGSDGNLWLTESGGEFTGITRLTPSGESTRLAGSPFAWDLAEGPDHNWWFHSFESSIGRWTPSTGATVEFPLPVGVGDMAWHTDGNLWLALNTSVGDPAQLGRMTTAGDFTRISTPAEIGQAGRIVSGANGDVWFTDILSNSIWRLSTGAAPGCTAAPTTLCLNGGRFEVRVSWSVPSQGSSGSGQAVPLTGDTGYFWFFNGENIELVIKVLDATGVDGKFWVFYGALSNVQYTITVTDMVTGAVRTYENPSGTLASVADTSAFSPAATSAASAAVASPQQIEERAADELYGLYGVLTKSTATPQAAAAGCTSGGTTLCLNQSRFRLTVDWEVPSQGTSGHGTAVPITGDTGYFWFFNGSNVELIVKVLDARGVNGHFWVFYGALSNVQYTITVTDTQTGTVKAYTNPSGRLASAADTSAF